MKIQMKIRLSADGTMWSAWKQVDVDDAALVFLTDQQLVAEVRRRLMMNDLGCRDTSSYR